MKNCQEPHFNNLNKQTRAKVNWEVNKYGKER